METSKEIKELHKEILYPSVRIRVKDTGGSGTIIYSEETPEEKNEEEFETYILTNWHVVEDAINIKEEWDPVKKEEVKEEYRDTVQVEVFDYEYLSENIGGMTLEADIVCWDKREDLALLKLRTIQEFNQIAELYSKDKEKEIKLFQDVYCVGSSLGHSPIVTEGQITSKVDEIDNKNYWMSNAQSIFGNCLPGDTEIFTSNGLKSIENIERDDKVYTYQGKRRVKNKFNSGEKEVFELRTSTRTIRASANHPFLIAKKEVEKRDKNDKPIEVTYNLEWEKLKNIEEGDPIVIANEINKTKEEINRTKPSAKARIQGFILGDGYIRYRPKHGGEIQIYSFDENKAKEFQKLVEETYGTRGQVTDDGCLSIYSASLAKELLEDGLDKKHINANVPNWIWGASRDIQREFLRGFFEADGSKRESGYLIEINNKELTEELRALCMLSGIRVGQIAERKRKTQYFNGKEITPNRKSVSFFAVTNPKKKYESLKGHWSLDFELLEDGYKFDKVKQITEEGKEETYDIEVEGSHNFIADGIVVHNSGGSMFLPNGEMIGIPARITAMQLGFGIDVITHMGFFIPINRIYDFLEDQIFDFIFKEDKTSEDCREERKKREKEEREKGGYKGKWTT